MTSTVDRVAEIKCTDSRARQGGGRGGGVAGVGGADPDGAWFAARGGRQLGRPSRDQSEPMDPVRNRERRRHCASAAYQGGRSPLPSSVPLVFFLSSSSLPSSLLLFHRLPRFLHLHHPQHPYHHYRLLRCLSFYWA